MTLSTKLARQDGRPSDPYWASAGIVDARTFTVGESDTVHFLTHAGPNTVRGRCGVTAKVTENDGRREACWSAELPDCERCAR